jgi:hypothetical protein
VGAGGLGERFARHGQAREHLLRGLVVLLRRGGAQANVAAVADGRPRAGELRRRRQGRAELAGALVGFQRIAPLAKL